LFGCIHGLIFPARLSLSSFLLSQRGAVGASSA
jgi:hypothetical protein